MNEGGDNSKHILKFYAEVGTKW